MTVPLRFDQLEPARQDAIRKNLDVMHAKGAPDADVESYLRDVEHLAPATPQPQGGLATRVIRNMGDAVGQLVRHPLDTIGGMAMSALHDLGTASDAMDAGMGQPSGLTPETAKRVPGALMRTAVNVALPSVAGGATKLAAKAGAGELLSELTGASAAGGVGGAAYTPEDPVAGGIAGALLGPAFGGTAKGVSRVAGKLGSAAVDIAGRPTESRPVIQAGPVKVGNIEGVNDRAARLNGQGLDRAGFFTDVKPDFVPNDKPLAPVDQHIGAQRIARGLKASSPAAEAVMRGTLEPRAEGAVERVISQAKDLTGIKRQNAFETTQQLQDRLNSESDANYGKVWAAEEGRGPVEHPDLAGVLNRPAVKQALPIASEMQANEGIVKPSAGRPPNIPDDQWALLKQAMERQGITPPSDGPGLTLQDLHSAKLAIDDMKRAGIERGPGAGGVGYNRSKSMGAAQKALLNVMDAWSPDYGKARATTADIHTLARAAEDGQGHWTRDPAESAAMLKEMTPDAQALYKSTAFDKWAERVENGPENVGKAQSKPLNQKRLRALFPDDASFTKFQQGLRDEATMHATKQGVLGGSNTADKLADMANDAGITLPEAMAAATGHFLPLLKGVAARGARTLSNASNERVSAERARLLTAGAGGDATAREGAIRKMARYPAPHADSPGIIGAAGILGPVSGASQSKP